MLTLPLNPLECLMILKLKGASHCSFILGLSILTGWNLGHTSV